MVTKKNEMTFITLSVWQFCNVKLFCYICIINPIKAK